MKRVNMLLIPAYITELYNKKEITLTQIIDKANWGNIFSKNTVDKINILNCRQIQYAADGANNNIISMLGISWMFDYVSGHEDVPHHYNFLQTLMSDGREGEVDLLNQHIHNFELDFDFVMTSTGDYVILFKELTEIDDICNRYVKIRSSMGKLIDAISPPTKTRDELVYEPVIQSYMTM